ncbi:DNA-binding protein HU [Minicystis rosea]|nr:DNA-binding protein HU [Minicystis rosea]
MATKKTAAKKTDKKTTGPKTAAKPSPKQTAAKKVTDKKAAAKPASEKTATKKPAAKPAPAKPATKATQKASTKTAPAKKAAEKQIVEKAAPAKKAPEKLAPVKKAAEKQAVEKVAPAKKAPEKLAPAKKAAEKQAVEKVAPAAAPKAPEKRVSERPAAKKPAEKRTTPSIAATSGISQEDAGRILAEVVANRRQPKGSSHAALPLKIVNPRRPKLVSELSPHELRQLVAAGADGTGEARTPEGWLDPADDSESFYGFLEVWDVVDAHGIPVYAVWMYQVDNGTVFRAGTIDAVGGISQGGLECQEEGLEEALLEAKARVDKTLLKDSLLRNMG